MTAASQTQDHKSRFLPYGIVGAVALVALMIGAYFLFEDREAWKHWIAEYLEIARGTPWALPFVCLTYVIGGAVLFPVMALNLACAIVFGLWGIVFALAGCLANAAVYFGLGRLLHKKYGEKLLSHPKLRKVDKGLNHVGITGVVAIHMVPVPPYTIVNLAAGLTTINAYVYLAGTMMVMLPGAIARGVVGDSLTKILLNPTSETYLYLVGGLVLWAGMLAAMHFAVKKFVPAAA